MIILNESAFQYENEPVYTVALEVPILKIIFNGPWYTELERFPKQNHTPQVGKIPSLQPAIPVRRSDRQMDGRTD